MTGQGSRERQQARRASERATMEYRLGLENATKSMAELRLLTSLLDRIEQLERALSDVERVLAQS